MKRYFYLSTLMMPLLTSLHAQAHYIPSQDEPITVNASLSATWRSDNIVEENEYWQIPGTNMGGDAWPVEKGVAIDEMKLGLGVRMNPNTYGIVEIGTHANDSDDHSSVNLEHAYLGYVCCEDNGPWVFEIGKMSAAFTPSLSEHATDRLASESPLVTDVFFGRYFHDDGVRVMWHTKSVVAGAEMWKGDAFPATASGDQSWDIFARYQWNNQNIKLTTGAFSYHASAETRSDHRYGGGHQHTPVAAPGETTSVFPDTRFTGDIDIYGINADISYSADNKSWKTGIKAEYMQMQMDGMLHNAGLNVVDLDSNQIGAWAQPYITWQKHTFGIRAEWLTSDNDITGAAANQLSIDSGMANPTNFEPSRYSAIWLWQWKENIALRTEVVDDQSLLEDNMRYGVGIIWKQSLWPLAAK
jgi:hypothetical protein